MGKRTWAPGAPDYLYHVYDDAAIPAAFTKGKVSVKRRDGAGTDPRDMYSLKKDMDQLRAYGVGKGIVDPKATLGTAAQHPEDRDLMVLKVGKGAAHPVLFAGCHHAREWISVEIPYLVAEYLIYNYTDAPQNDKQKRIKHLLLNREIWFVPMTNPDGHVRSVKENRRWRPNVNKYSLPSTLAPNPPLTAKQYVPVGSPALPDHVIRYPAATYTGVDINRNYPTKAWGQETSGTSRDPTTGGADSVWCGPSANSEPETKLMVKLFNEKKFRSTITYHNFWEVIFYPDDAVGDVFVEWVGNGMVTLMAEAPGHTYQFWNNSSTVDPSNYLTTGELVDFAYEVSPKRPAYTPELRPKQPAPKGWEFSGLPESEIEPCFLENLKAALALINCAGHDAKAAPQTSGVATATPPAKFQAVRSCWDVFRGWTP